MDIRLIFLNCLWLVNEETCCSTSCALLDLRRDDEDVWQENPSHTQSKSFLEFRASARENERERGTRKSFYALTPTLAEIRMKGIISGVGVRDPHATVPKTDTGGLGE